MGSIAKLEMLNIKIAWEYKQVEKKKKIHKALMAFKSKK
jgi:hypothetical protein